ncbi:MAG: VWA domain-containing protein [Proteobacteria bacterium]|nr:VWA domain-containing protein [Pseudomonadota bacterium]
MSLPLRTAHHTAISLFVCLVLGGSPGAAADTASSKSQGPYIMVTSETALPDPLPLKETHGEVHIAGVIAHVRITQVYRNEGTRPLEAIYVFPGSTRSAVFGMRMKIGERTIEAAIEKREVARTLYEQAKRRGKTASLLEQHRPNVFQMNVANVLPGDTVRVELDYTELIVPDESVYEFVYPAVVGPRYSGEQERGETWHQNPYLGEGENEPYRFALNVHLSTGMGIQSLSSPSHQVKPTFRDAGAAHLSLGDKGDGDRDFVLRYRLRGNAVKTGLLRYDGDKEKFFLLMIQPPSRVMREQMPPREYVFIVDVSGSMSGYPLGVSKELVRDLLSGLRPVDRFNILFFAGGSYQLSAHSIPASRKNVAQALQVLDERRGGGGTNLLAALRHALAMPAAEGTSRTFVAVTDGYVNVEAEAFRLVRKNLGRANFFAFGIGTSVNRHLIEGLARAGMGQPFVVLGQNQARQEAGRFRRLIESPALTDIELSFAGFDAYDVEPPAVPDLLAERPLVIFGKYRGTPDGTISVRGTSGAGPYQRTLRVADFAPQASHSALRYLWARHRVRALKDREQFWSENVKDQITELALRYHLMTDYTSFVAVDRVERSQAGDPTTVKQPLLLPRGVSRNALSGAHNVTVTGSPRRPTASRDVADSLSYGSSAGIEGADEMIDITGVSIASHWPQDDLRSATLSVSAVDRISIGQRLSLSSRDDVRGFSMPTLLRVGVTDNSEVRISSNLVSLSNGDLDRPDLTLGSKLTLWNRYRSLGLAALADVTFDFDDDTDRDQQARLLMLAAHAVSPRLTLRANLGLGLLRLSSSDSLDGSFLYAAELAYRIGWRWLTFAAASGSLADESTLAVEAGLSRRLTDNLLLGLSASAGLTDAQDEIAGSFYVRWSL